MVEQRGTKAKTISSEREEERASAEFAELRELLFAGERRATDARVASALASFRAELARRLDALEERVESELRAFSERLEALAAASGGLDGALDELRANAVQRAALAELLGELARRLAEDEPRS